MAVTAAAAHVTVGFFLRAVDGSLLGLKELQDDREAKWVESVWTYRLPVSYWSIAPSYTHTYTHTHTHTHTHTPSPTMTHTLGAGKQKQNTSLCFYYDTDNNRFPSQIALLSVC